MARVRPQPPAQRCKLGVEHVQDHPGLDDDVVRPHAHDPAEMAAEVDHQPGAERLPRQAGPGPPRMERDRVLRRVPDQGDDVLVRPGDYRAQGVDLVEAGVVRVRRAPDRLEQEFAAEDAPEVVVNPGPAFVHGGLAIDRNRKGERGPAALADHSRYRR